MAKQMHFCDKCESYTVGYPADAHREVEIRGVKLNVPYEGFFCEFCGEELYVDAVESKIYRTGADMYRERKRMLTPDTLNIALKNITPEELAQKADCSVREIIAVSRHGALQSQTTDDKLQIALGMKKAVA